MRHSCHPLLLVLVVACCGLFLMAADGSDPDLPQSNPLAGKAVIVEQEGVVARVEENVTLRNAFLCFQQKDRDGTEYEYWLPLRKVDELKVFDRFEDAVAHHKRRWPALYKDENK
jgi:hypothetical protein